MELRQLINSLKGGEFGIFTLVAAKQNLIAPQKYLHIYQ
jgi:hypothetical protein